MTIIAFIERNKTEVVRSRGRFAQGLKVKVTGWFGCGAGATSQPRKQGDVPSSVPNPAGLGLKGTLPPPQAFWCSPLPTDRPDDRARPQSPPHAGGRVPRHGFADFERVLHEQGENATADTRKRIFNQLSIAARRSGKTHCLLPIEDTIRGGPGLAAGYQFVRLSSP